MPQNDLHGPQGDATEAQQAPQAVTVETTLEAIESIIRQAGSVWYSDDAEAIRAHLEALVKAARQEEYDMGSAMARRENRASYDQITYLEAENARLRAALEQIQGSARYTFPDTPIGDVCVALQEQVREMKAQARAALSPESEGG